MPDRFARKSARILVVDDEPQNIRLIQGMLAPEGYVTEGASCASEALALIAQAQPDLVLLDVLMPDMNGFQVARKLKNDPATASLPVIMVSALEDRRSELLGLNAGAIDFLSKPVNRFELSIRVRNLLRLKECSDFLNNHNLLLKRQVSEQTTSLRDSYLETIFALGRASRHKDEETGAHVRRISYFCRLLAGELGMTPLYVENIFYASPMHDIGKIGIPDHILLKAGPHTPEESAIMRRHSQLGADILGTSTSPYLEMAAEIALSHHERWNGGGYPNGLKGEAIPMSARIMAICDVYDALRSKRPYKPALDHDVTTRIIIEGDGRTEPDHFDPTVLQAFLDNAERFRELFETHHDVQEH